MAVLRGEVFALEVVDLRNESRNEERKENEFGSFFSFVLIPFFSADEISQSLSSSSLTVFSVLASSASSCSLRRASISAADIALCVE